MTLNETYTDLQVLGALVKNPLLLAEADNDLTLNDFGSRVSRIVFLAVTNLVRSGVEKLDPIVVDTYVQQHDGLKAEFDRQNGLLFLQEAMESVHVENFKYYVARLKKLSLLRRLKEEDYDISHFFKENFSSLKEEKEYNERFDQVSLEDILDRIEGKLAAIRSEFQSQPIGNTSSAFGLRELKQELKEAPDFGIDLPGNYYNAIVRGARLGKFYLRSSATGTGKTRLAIFEACDIAFPKRWSHEANGFVTYRKEPQRVLIIPTEMKRDELQTIILAYVAGVDEKKILHANYSWEEEKRLDKAIGIIEEYEKFLYIEQVSNPNPSNVRACIKKHHMLNGVRYVFYDYLYMSGSLASSVGTEKLREDTVLLLLSTELKNIAEDYGIFVSSSTQLNSDGLKWSTPKNEACLRGAKAIADKIDVGIIISEAAQEDLVNLESVLYNLPLDRAHLAPTHVFDLYKMRRGLFKHARIWSHIHLGTGFRKDLFVTWPSYEIIADCLEMESCPYDILKD